MSFGDYGSGGGNRGGGGGGYERMGNGGGGGGGRYQSGGGDAFAECTQKITANTFTINSNVQALQKITSFLGTARDTGDMRARAKQMQDQTTMIIRDTSAELKRLGTINEGNARERRLQGDKLSKDLRAVITKWSSACQGYIGKERNTVGRQRAASGREGGGGGFGGGGGGGGGYDEKASLIEAEQRRKMEQMDQQVMSNDSLIQEREDAIKDIESQMLEVNDIFKDLSVAVQDQGHQLDSIEANMSQAYSSVDDGAQQLEKANRYQKKSRNKMCCFLLILIIVLAIVVVPLVLKNNKPAAPNKTLTWQNNF